MTLDHAKQTVETHLRRMDQAYGARVFDEWAMVAAMNQKVKVLAYAGSRQEDFQQRFVEDVAVFRSALIAPAQNIGDFDFNRDASGTQFDAYLVVGDGIFLLCNNTQQTMSTICANPRWLEAQVSFAELSDAFRSDPVIFPM